MNDPEQLTCKRPSLNSSPPEELREAVARRLLSVADADIQRLFGADGSLLPRSEWPEEFGGGMMRLIVTETMLDGVKTEERHHMSFGSLDDSMRLLHRALPPKKADDPEAQARSERLQGAIARMAAYDKEKETAERFRIKGRDRIRREAARAGWEAGEHYVCSITAAPIDADAHPLASAERAVEKTLGADKPAAESISELPADRLREAVLERLLTECEADTRKLFGSDGLLRPASEWPEGFRLGSVKVSVTEVFSGGVKVGERKRTVFGDLRTATRQLARTLPPKQQVNPHEGRAARMQKAEAIHRQEEVAATAAALQRDDLKMKEWYEEWTTEKAARN